MRLLIAVSLLLTSTLASANFETITRVVTGYGDNQDLAISNALVEAVSQVNGVTINSQEVMESFTTDNYYADNDTEVSEFSVDVSSQQAVSRATGGYIDEYTVNSVTAVDTGYAAELTVTFYRYSVPGLDDNRRSIAILPFDSPDEVTRSHPQATNLITNHLIDYFTQSRRFSVVDRSNTEHYEAEKEIWLSADSSELEELRIGNMRGADYLIVGTLTDIRTEDNSRFLQTTGEHIEDVSTRVTVRYRIVSPATRQIKWASTEAVEVSGSDINPNDFARAVSEQIGQSALSNIYPPRIAAIEGNQIVINQGGSTITEGSQVDVFSLGDIIQDPYSGEPMGRVETRVGTAVIARVLPQVAYLEPLDGDLSGLSIGDIVRPVSDASADASEPARRESDAEVMDTGVKLF